MSDDSPPQTVNVWAVRAAAAKEVKRTEPQPEANARKQQQQQQQREQRPAIAQQGGGAKGAGSQQPSEAAPKGESKPFSWKKVDAVQPLPAQNGGHSAGGGGPGANGMSSSASDAQADEGEGEGDGEYVTEEINVQPGCAGFIVGPLGRVVAEISHLTFTHVISPRKGDTPIFSVSGPGACVKAAVALIRVREQEALEKESRSGISSQPSTRASRTVPGSLVGYVMGRERAVINDISRQTRTQITCPVKGGPPEFDIEGPKLCVEAASLCIKAKLHLAKGSMMMWQAEWYQQETIEIIVPSDRVGFVVGLMGSVINSIAANTGTQIVSPKKGHDPVFVVTGPRHSVLRAKAAIEDKANGPKGSAGHLHGQKNRKKVNRASKAFTAMPSVVSWFPPKPKP